MSFLRPLLILALAAGIGYYIIATKPKPEPVSVKEKAWPVRTQVAVPERQSPTLALYGRVESLWSSQLTAGVAADVRQVKVIEGSVVTKDAVLVSLDDRDSRLQLAQRKADLAELEAKLLASRTANKANEENLKRERRLFELGQAEVGRLEDLVKKRLVSDSSVDKTRQDAERLGITLRAREQQLQTHEADLAELAAKKLRLTALYDQAQLELDRTQVRAPFNARIAKVLVSPGKRVRVGDPLVELYDTDAMVVRAQLPSRFIAEVKEARKRGDELWIAGRVDGHPIKAKLMQLAGEATSATGGIEALFALDSSEGLEQGRFVRIDLTLPPQDNVVALPPEAIYGSDRVYRLTMDDRLEPVTVQRVGERHYDKNKTLVLVTSGALKAGDLVITTQLPNAMQGLLANPSGEKGEPMVRIRDRASEAPVQ